MKIGNHVKKVLIVIGVMLTLFPNMLSAYVDPGTGSYMIQIILAAIVGAAFTIKMYWIKIKNFLSKLFSRKNNIN